MIEIYLKKSKIAEVVDLNAFYKILQWIKGANNFKNYGNSYLIEQNIENEKLSKNAFMSEATGSLHQQFSYYLMEIQQITINMG